MNTILHHIKKNGADGHVFFYYTYFDMYNYEKERFLL